MTLDDVLAMLFHPFSMLWMGQGLHVLKKLRELEMSGRETTFRAYSQAHPWSMLFSIVAGLVAYGFLHEANQLNAASAFTAGYMADSMVNAFTRREAKLRTGDEHAADDN